MLRDVVVHLHNEQPVLADLLTEPTAQDTCVICTNLRTMNGKQPVFVDRTDSTFVLPMAHIRFIEVHAGTVLESDSDEAQPADAAAPDEPARGLKSGNGDGPDPGEGQGGGSPLDRLEWSRDGASGPLRDYVAELPGDSYLDDGDLLRRVRDV